MATSVTQETYEMLSKQLRHPIDQLSLLQQSLLFAELAKLSYYTPEMVSASVSQVGFDRHQYFDRDGAQAYIFESDHDCVVVCRGTEPGEWNDLKADANAVSVVADTAGRVHRGFKREVDDLWPRLEFALKENRKPLWFSGHSLGGAMATICAGRCKIAEIASNPAALFTYGSPRVGNNRYINFVDIKHYRWVNNNDIVCRVPPAWMGYRHCGREFYFNSFGRLRKYTRFRRFRDRCYGFILSLRKFKIDHLADHSMDCYIANLERAVADEDAGKIKKQEK